MEAPPGTMGRFLLLWSSQGRKAEGGLQHMAEGTVTRFNEQKGYGFISPNHGGGGVFVRYSDIEGAGFRILQEGEKVTYDVAQHRKGVQAQNLAEALAVKDRNRWGVTEYPTKGENAMEREQRTDGITALEDYFSGYEVYDPARSKIGTVGDLFVDEDDRPKYVGVKTGFLGTKTTLIPWQIVEVKDGEKRLVVAADKDADKGGPAFDDREVTPEYEEEIHSYNGLKGRRPLRIEDAMERTSGTQRENIPARSTPL
jgi:CspA family cold shock protein